MTGPNPAPEVSASWDRIEAWLGAHAPQTLATLLPPADPAAVRAAAEQLGVTFPDDLVASLARHEGSRSDAAGRFCIAGDGLSPLATVERNNTSRADVLEDIDADLTGGHYWHLQFVQVTDCSTADGLVVDCRPGPTYGAVGSFFNGEGTTFGLWPSFAAMLAALADALESGGAVRRMTPVAFGGLLTWEQERPALPEPPSLLEPAAAAQPPRASPAGAARRRTTRSFVPVPEAGWVGEYPNFCLAFVHGIDAAELLRRYGAIPETVRPRTRGEADEVIEARTDGDGDGYGYGYLPMVRAGMAGAWAFGFEQGVGRHESQRAEVRRRLSEGTRAVWVSYAAQVQLAVFDDGVTTTEYAGSRAESRSGTDPDLLARALHGAGLLPLDLTRYQDQDAYAALDVLATEFGIGFDGAVLDGPLLSGRILPVLTDARAMAVPASGEPAVAGLVACAAEGRLRTALLAQTRRLAAETGLDRYPEVADALARAEAGEAWAVENESPLGRRLRQVAAEARAAARSRTDPATRGLLTEPERMTWNWRDAAGRAVCAVVGLPPREAAFEVLHQRRDPDWRAQFAADLGEVDVPEGTVERLQEAERREYQEKVALGRRQPYTPGRAQRPQRPRPAAQRFPARGGRVVGPTAVRAVRPRQQPPES